MLERGNSIVNTISICNIFFLQVAIRICIGRWIFIIDSSQRCLRERISKLFEPEKKTASNMEERIKWKSGKFGGVRYEGKRVDKNKNYSIDLLEN